MSGELENCRIEPCQAEESKPPFQHTGGGLDAAAAFCLPLLAGTSATRQKCGWAEGATGGTLASGSWRESH